MCDLEGNVVGVVSEGDILYKEHDPRGAHTPGLLGWVTDGTHAAGSTKAAALTVRKAMTAPALTIAPHASVAEVARIMSERGVNRLPVVKDRRLVGIVTRTDLVRAFIRTDAEIETELREDVIRRALWVDAEKLEVAVAGGSVSLSGELHARSDVELLERLTRRVPGVVAVESTVKWRIDDTRRGRRPALTAATR